ncbi:hypothetical protein TOI97_03675 [Denitrificimonas sp. JX-1]|uniref:Uncharacterized protein n=1 Tax=Denitrificimonas halotolerans TaxID=3098930 RepID=A0ABU5GNT9_9GAMM|nr:hypothetical protein [Denitrificimonas sp. JX-1]MDY7218673.1 hypothetical protein [Denitrificimonas sp. JX-1]
MSETLALNNEQYIGLLKLLAVAQQQRRVMTYRQVIEKLQLPAPSVRRLATTLERLAQQDHQHQRPLRSALVVSQAQPAHPQLGFMEYVQKLGRFQGHMDESNVAAWLETELAQVYSYSYPEV